MGGREGGRDSSQPSQHSDSSIETIPADKIDERFGNTTIDLIAADLGGRVLGVSDEWFADAGNLIKPGDVERRVGVFDWRGAW